jgi:hypothetical protein
MADVTVNLTGVAGTSHSGSLAPTAGASVSLSGVESKASPGRLKALPRPLKIGTPAMMIPPPPPR